LRALLDASTLLRRTPERGFQLRPEVSDEVAEARSAFSRAQADCVERVKTAILAETERLDALEGVDLSRVLDEYLCVAFSEIRLMANYFRETTQLFNSGPEGFARFDYVLRRHVGRRHELYFAAWRRGFISGLRTTAETQNPYIASVFHNVLATYYLNR